MSKINDGGPAFPVRYDAACDGLTKREYVATAIMAAIVTAYHQSEPGLTKLATDPRGAVENIAASAIGHADALIAELRKDGQCQSK